MPLRCWRHWSEALLISKLPGAYMKLQSLGGGFSALFLTQDEHKNLGSCLDHGLKYFESLGLEHHPEMRDDAYAVKMATERIGGSSELEAALMLSHAQCCAIDMILASPSALYDELPGFDLSREEVTAMDKKFDALLNGSVRTERDL